MAKNQDKVFVTILRLHGGAGVVDVVDAENAAAATKFARAKADELGKHGVTVNAVEVVEAKIQTIPVEKAGKT